MKDCDHIVGRIGNKLYNASDYQREYEINLKKIQAWALTNQVTPNEYWHETFSYCTKCGAYLLECKSK